ncbi:hypothetical protein AB1Y20_003780 [Prymnesium parvum]|uniref:Ribosomal protein/NADH dehydrogenase domain-containing protein n=1 Tax=Prymnesium parvum TaxID=97485 RepID=A0AB34J5N8_PRYPA
MAFGYAPARWGSITGASVAAWPPAFSRGLARSPKRRKKSKEKKPLNTKWDHLIEKYTAIPMVIPGLKTFEMQHGRSTDGQGGIRKFLAAHTAQIRYQNPEANVLCRASRDEVEALIRLEMKDGKEYLIDATGKKSQEILREVLTTAGVEPAKVAEAVQLRVAEIEAQHKEREEAARRKRMAGAKMDPDAIPDTEQPVAIEGSAETAGQIADGAASDGAADAGSQDTSDAASKVAADMAGNESIDKLEATGDGGATTKG